MELQLVELHGFRRFAAKTEIKTNGKLVALLGPNEAGKTSILRAISTIGHAVPFEKEDLTRGLSLNGSHVVLLAKFRLNKEDLEAANLTGPRWYILERTVSGQQLGSFDPPVQKRDISNRISILSVIEKIKSNNKLWGRVVTEDEMASEIFENAISSLSSKDETLSESHLSEISELSRFCAGSQVESDPKYFRDLPILIDSQIEREREKTPLRIAMDAVFGRMPKILFFSNDDRLLKGSYGLEELAEDVPAALENLSKVANIDIKEFIGAIRDDDAPAIARIKSKANVELKKKFDENWSQSGVTVALDVLNRQIQVLVQEENFEFTRLAERSDGLRQFVALQAFTTCERAEDPILLIDEAEIRLHYDAQADLVQMLSRQKVSSKIIYTTHSAGCLPEDLGNGVRLVDYVGGDEEAPTSTVKNQFWNRTEGGLAPLLFGMGAATLAFFPIRRALLTEGESDMLLLPTMLREIYGTDSLTFQIVPGLSKTSGINLPILARNGTGIAFALDFDDGGRDLEKKILGAGFAKEDVFYLKGSGKTEQQIEDFINPKLLAQAVNEAFRELGTEKKPITPSEFNASGRLEKIRVHFGLKKKGEIPKTLIAYHVLDILLKEPDLNIVDQKKKSNFTLFANNVRDYLNKD
ncbi:MAG: AAA family ATPase [Sphingobium sp.]|nr:AAA family ATPase [Sphingobium sp.]